MKLGYADPPYPGCAHLYSEHPDFAGEVDHRALVERLDAEFDGWVLHTHIPGLRMMEREHSLLCQSWRYGKANFVTCLKCRSAWHTLTHHR